MVSNPPTANHKLFGNLPDGVNIFPTHVARCCCTLQPQENRLSSVEDAIYDSCCKNARGFCKPNIVLFSYQKSLLKAKQKEISKSPKIVSKAFGNLPDVTNVSPVIIALD